MPNVSNVRVYALDDSIRAAKYPKAVELDGLTAELTKSILACSTMHKLQNMNPRLQCNRYVDPRAIDILQEKIDRYNWLVAMNKKPEYSINPDEIKEARLEMLYNIPSGFELTAAMTTNYRQLKTIYQQRRNHALTDWQVFCDFCETLPRFLELTQRGYEPNE